jgi:hypothetical protein
MSYEDYIQKQLLQPNNINSFRIAENGGSESGLWADSLPLARMAACAGWTASAADILRFINLVDGFPEIPDILSPSSIKSMSSGSTANSAYACGWVVSMNGSWWHAGSLPGSAAEIIRTADGYDCVILCNTRADGPFFNDLDLLLRALINLNDR